MSELLAHHDWALNNLAEGKNEDVMLIDFAKVFDKVDVDMLLPKVKALRITGKLGRWSCAFLTNPLQAVTMDGHSSETMPVFRISPGPSLLPDPHVGH